MQTQGVSFIFVSIYIQLSIEPRNSGSQTNCWMFRILIWISCESSSTTMNESASIFWWISFLTRIKKLHSKAKFRFQNLVLHHDWWLRCCVLLILTTHNFLNFLYWIIGFSPPTFHPEYYGCFFVVKAENCQVQTLKFHS